MRAETGAGTSSSTIANAPASSSPLASPTAALNFHRGHASLLNRAAAIEDRALNACLVGQKGHVDDDERARHTATDGGGVVDHVIQRHRQCRGVSHHGGSNRIADENRVDAGFIDESPEQRIVRSHDDDLLALALALGEIADGYWPLLTASGSQRPLRRVASSASQKSRLDNSG